MSSCADVELFTKLVIMLFQMCQMYGPSNAIILSTFRGHMKTRYLAVVVNKYFCSLLSVSHVCKLGLQNLSVY